MGVFFIIAVMVILFGIGAYFSYLQAKKRREAFEALARRLGMTYRADRDYGFDEMYPFLNKLCQGSGRYAFNILTGVYQGHPVTVFDYHYETRSTDSKGRSKKTSHYFSFFILYLDGNFPELIITHEGWLSKVAQFFGYDDIDFESAEFSRKFCVRSSNKKVAYDICNARMIDYLLNNPDLDIEIEHNCLTFFFSRRLSVDGIEPNLQRLIQIRNLFPDYLFSRQSS